MVDAKPVIWSPLADDDLGQPFAKGQFEESFGGLQITFFKSKEKSKEKILEAESRVIGS
jgi:hypothetical protein